MLEQPILVIHGPDATGRRLVAGPHGSAVGFVAWRPAPPGALRRLLCPRVLELREMEEASLLGTVQRAWTLFGWRDVRDADDHFIGRILGGIVQDHDCRRVALVKEEGTHRVFEAASGQPLAQLWREGTGLRLTFTDAVAHEPFHKMLLLAATLVA